MTKILYIPDGTYITFMGWYNEYTTQLERIDLNEYEDCQDPKTAKGWLYWILNTTQKQCKFRKRNALPNEIFENEFEIIYD